MHRKRWYAMLAATMLGAATTVPSLAFAHGLSGPGMKRLGPHQRNWMSVNPFPHFDHGPHHVTSWGRPESDHGNVRSEDRGKSRRAKPSRDQNQSHHTAGVVNAVYQNAVVIDGQSLLTSASTAVRYRSYHLTVGDIPTGVKAMAVVKSGGRAKRIQLQQDFNLPPEPSIVGAVYASGPRTIQVRSYTLALAPQVKIRYHSWRLNLSEVPDGARAKVHLTQSALVSQIKLFTDSALPPQPTVTGTVSAVYQSGLTVKGYPLRYASSPVRVMKRGHRMQLAAIMIGQRVKVRLNRRQHIVWVKIFPQQQDGRPPHRDH